jgi:predicted short-subunit dehydrogenase-like oxidoreductase (DUF2520 family)
MKRIVIIGSGNVAEALVRAVGTARGYELAQVAARNEERGRRLAEMAGCGYTHKWGDVVKADIYLIAVSDSAIGSLSEQIDFGGGVVAHTAGGMSLGALSATIKHRAALYPLQTFSAGREVDFTHAPLFIEASTRQAVDAIDNLAQRLSNRVRYTSSEQRARAHLAAVFACNFTNYMYATAERVLSDAGMEFELLAPLIEECASKAIAAGSPLLTQTGPAVRGDTVTQNNHRAMLADAQLREIYITLSENIWQTSRKR